MALNLLLMLWLITEESIKSHTTVHCLLRLLLFLKKSFLSVNNIMQYYIVLCFCGTVLILVIVNKSVISKG